MSVKTVDKIVMRKLDSITPYDKNPRKNSKTVELLVQVIPKVGFNVPLVLDKDGVIVKGHARYYAATILGMDEIPCVISDASPEEIKLDRIADNKVFEFSKWDDEELLHEVDMLNLDIDMSMFGLPSVGGEGFEEFEFNDDDDIELSQEAIDERRRRFEEMIAQEADPVMITTQTGIDHAKMAQREEAQKPPKYFMVVCEKCGAVMYIREGDAITWG